MTGQDKAKGGCGGKSREAIKPEQKPSTATNAAQKSKQKAGSERSKAWAGAVKGARESKQVTTQTLHHQTSS